MGASNRTWAVVRGLLGVVLVLGSCRSEPSQTRVLFVGNSRIYFHDQPAMLQALAEANGHRLAWEMRVEGGATLRDHIRGGVLDSIRAGGWDAVVANEQTTWGLARYVEGAVRVPEAPEEFFASVDSLAAATVAIGAELLLIVHPRQRDMPAEDGDRLIAGFAAAATRHPRIRIVPLESAWQLASRMLPDQELYEEDGSHPSRLGALVSAVGIYETLFGRPPANVPDIIVGPFVEEGDGILHRDSIVELVAIDPAMGPTLSDLARRARERWTEDRERAGRVQTYDVPRLPEPLQEIDLAALRGAWEGELRVYPRFATWPAKMSLVIEGEGDPTASMHVSFGGSPSDIHYPTLPLSNEGAYVQLVDPDGPNGGFVRYRLVPRADTLKGIAEFSNDGSVYGIGSVVLTRARR